MLLADTLSRTYLPESVSTGSVEVELETINQHDTTLTNFREQTLYNLFEKRIKKKLTNTDQNHLTGMDKVSGGAELLGQNHVEEGKSCYPY